MTQGAHKEDRPCRQGHFLATDYRRLSKFLNKNQAFDTPRQYS